MTEVERLCVEAATAGTVADLLRRPEEERTLSAKFLRTLLRARDPADPTKVLDVDPLGVRIKGLIVKEPLDLRRLDIPFPIELTKATFRGRVTMVNAKVRAVCFDGSTFKAHCDAEGIEIGADFSAQEAKYEDWLSLAGAEIAGSLWLNGAKLHVKSPVPRLAAYGHQLTAFFGDGMDVGGHVFFRSKSTRLRFEAKAEVRLLGAKIGGNWECTGGSFKNPNGEAISADRAEIGGSVLLSSQSESLRFAAEGGVRLLGAKIAANWECIGGSFKNPNGDAISADRAEIGGSVLLSSQSKSLRFKAEGQVSLNGAKIGGNWECTGGSFKNPNGAAINAEGVEVGGSVFFRSLSESLRCEAAGEVRLLGAKIGGNWECTGGSFKNPNGDAISADNADVSGDVFFSAQSETERFEAEGAVRLLGAKIGRNWECDGGSFKNADGDAISADNAEVGGDAFFRGSQPCTFILGSVSLSSATVAGHLQWLEVKGTPSVKLAHARVGTLDLNPPEDGANWRLNGFLYVGFKDPAKASGETMLKFLRASDGGAYLPQPYRQLFRTLRDAGHAREAKDVAIAMRKAAFDSEQARIPRASGRPSCWKKLTRWRQVLEWHSRRALKHKSAGESRVMNSQESVIDQNARADATQKGFGTIEGEVSKVEAEPKAKEPGSKPQAPAKGLGFKAKARVARKLISMGIKQLPSETVDSIRALWGVSGVAIKKCFSWIVGYGYIPSRVFWLSLGIVLGASSICAGAVLGNFLSLLDPVDGGRLDALQVNPSHRWGDDSPKFIAFIYVLDRFLPIVDLGQASAFRPKDIGLLILDWVLIGSGWILTTLLVGSVSGLMRRIDSDQ